MMRPVLEIRDLRLDAEDAGDGAVPIVQGINLKVQPGEVHALIGESGSGKTTIALTALGYVRPGMKRVTGSVLLNGKDLFEFSREELRRVRGNRVSYVSQSAAASFNPSIRIGAQVVEVTHEHELMPADEAKTSALKLYEELQIPSPETISRRFPHEVSGGQLQRLMAAMAMISGPELIIFDEPTTALDVTTQLSVLMSFKSLIKRRNTAAIYVTHDLAVVAQIADQVTVLLNGEIKEQGDIQSIVKSPKHNYSRTLMEAGTPVEDYSHSSVAEEVTTTPLLELKGVDAGYGPVQNNGLSKFPVLKNIAIAMQRGSVLGIIGESGSGKSTMARVIAGLLPPSGGELFLSGERLAPRIDDRSKETVRRIQIVSQSADTALNPSHRIGKILGRPVEYFQGLKGAAKRKKVFELLRLVSLPDEIANRRPHELSGGQKQRINLARALAANPDIILCDEVTSALDSVVRNSIVELIGELRTKLNVAIVFISHDVSTVSKVADRVAVMYKGEVVETGATGTVLTSPKHAYTRLLLNSVPRVEIGWIDRAYLKIRAEQAELVHTLART